MGYARSVIQFPPSRIVRGDILADAGLSLFADDERLVHAEQPADLSSTDDANEKWPLAWTAAFVVASSACLWGAIIFGIMQLI